MLSLLKTSLLAAYMLANAVSIYNIHITTTEGVDRSMSDFKGRKILILILPATNTASNSIYLKTIDSLSRSYSDSITVIGVPSYDFGYADATGQSLQTYYRGLLGQQVIITQGMHTTISSGSLQQPLFSWLTQTSQNTHFSQEVKGVGQKYFISGQGELYAVFGPEMNLTDKLMQFMVNNNSSVFLGQK